jgi:hypothetical protein
VKRGFAPPHFFCPPKTGGKGVERDCGEQSSMPQRRLEHLLPALASRLTVALNNLGAVKSLGYID